MNSKERSSVRERILERIERNEVHMHSRAYFALKLAAVVLIAGVVLALTVFLGNLLFFTLRLNGHGSLLSLGARGWFIFVRVFPWWLLVADVVLSVALVWLVRHFQFGYRKPILAVFFGLAFLALVGGFALDRGTPLNDRLLRDADHGGLPHPLDSVYRGARRSPPPGTAYRGTIVAADANSITLTDPDLDSLVTVLLPKQGRAATEHFSVGSTVFVVGDRQGTVIQAYDIHPIDERALPPPEDD